MTVILIAIFAGLLLGSAWAGAVGWYFFLSRSYRQVRNLIVIGLGYLLVGTLGIGSLLLLFSFCDFMGIHRRSSVQDAAKFLAVSTSTLYGWVYQRRIPFVKVGGALRFELAELQKLVQSNRFQVQA